MMLPMISGKYSRFGGVGFIVAAATAFARVGCVSAPEVMRMEPRSVAEKLGYPGCGVSVPLHPAEAVEMGRALKIYPNPAEDPEWSKMLAIRRPEDQLRRVSCESNKLSSYVLIRNDEVVFKFDIGFFD